MIFKLITSLIIVALILPIFSFCQAESSVIANNFSSSKSLWAKVLSFFVETSIRAAKGAGEILYKLWNIILREAKYFWEYKVLPQISKIWKEIQSFFKKEAEKRKPVIEKEFQKEKEEIKKEIPKTGETLWERFKEIIK